MQYNRRELIKFHGIPDTVSDGNLEKTWVDILEDIGVGKIKNYRVHACLRLKNKNKAIIRFISRKTADSALHHRAKLKDLNNEEHGFSAQTKIFINENLCPPMQYLAYLVRCALKSGKIAAYNLWKGKLSIQMTKEGSKIEIGHIQDLIDIDLANDSHREKFISSCWPSCSHCCH